MRLALVIALSAPLLVFAAGFPRTPVSFVENTGQVTDMSGAAQPHVLFTADAPGMKLFLNDSGITYLFVQNERWERIDLVIPGAVISRRSLRSFSKANAVSKYFLANCPGGVEAKHYDSLVFSSVLPGIDWVIYGASGAGIKYDFVVHRGTKARVNLWYRSAGGCRLVNGALQISGSMASVAETAPVSFALPQGEPVASAFRLGGTSPFRGGQQCSVWLEAAEAPGDVVIDPALTWATYVGGVQADRIRTLETDPYGNLFAGGASTSINFPTSNNGQYFQGTLVPGGNPDAVIMKFRPDASLEWATFYGGNSFDEISELAIDGSGNVYATGWTGSTTFPVMNAGGFYQGSFAGGGSGPLGGPSDAFILKFSNNGQRLWATYCGGNGSGDEQGYSVACDASGNVYMTGRSPSPNFPVLNAGGYFVGSNPSGVGRAFILKFSSSTSLQWGTYFGNQSVSGNAITIAPSGAVLLAGHVDQSGSVPVTSSPGAFSQSTPSGGRDGFIAAFSPATALTWCTYFGGGSFDQATDICTTRNGRVIVSGLSSSPSLPTVNGGGYFQATTASPGFPDIFIASFNASYAMQWGTFFGGATAESIDSHDHIVADSCGSVYIALDVTAQNLPMLQPCDGGYFDNTVQGSDNCITRFSPTGRLEWCTAFGGSGTDYGTCLALNDSYLFAGGLWGAGSSYPASSGGAASFFSPTSNGNTDGFVARFAPGGPPTQSVLKYSSPVCKTTGTLAPLTASQVLGGGVYSAGSGLVINPVTGVLTPSASAQGNYTVTYTGGVCGCFSSPALTATVAISSSLALSVKNVTSCPGQPVIMVADPSPSDNVSYLWTAGESSDSVYIVSNTGGTYSLTASRAGCTATASATYSILPARQPTVSFHYDETLCNTYPEGVPSFDSTFTFGGIFEASDSLQVDSAGHIQTFNMPPATYIVNYSIAPHGCVLSGSFSTVVNIATPGYLRISPYQAIKPGQGVPLTVSGGSEYKWKDSPYLSCLECDAPVATPPETTTFCVESGINGCYTSTCVLVEVLCGNDGDLSVPNIFTPNGDGRNDQFCLRGWEDCNTAFDIKIFDRWGEMVYESDKPNFCWDGVYNGTPLNNGVYVYTINATFNHDQVVKKGNITITR